MDDLIDDARRSIQAVREELVRLRKIELAAWHLVDDADERTDEAFSRSVVLGVSRSKYEALCALLSEERPVTSEAPLVVGDRVRMEHGKDPSKGTIVKVGCEVQWDEWPAAMGTRVYEPGMLARLDEEVSR